MTHPATEVTPIEVLLVEDDPGDVLMTREAFEEHLVNNTLRVVNDGVQALAYLRLEEPFTHAVRPDLILLDLNLPRRDRRQALQDIQNDAALPPLPGGRLTTSQRPAATPRRPPP